MIFIAQLEGHPMCPLLSMRKTGDSVRPLVKCYQCQVASVNKGVLHAFRSKQTLCPHLRPSLHGVAMTRSLHSLHCSIVHLDTVIYTLAKARSGWIS